MGAAKIVAEFLQSKFYRAGSIHPFTHTIYTILNGYYSPYLPTAALQVADAPEEVMNLLTNDDYLSEINSTYEIYDDDDNCKIAQFLFKPEPIVPTNQKNFLDLENVNDLVNPEKPSSDSVKLAFSNRLLGTDSLKNMEKYFPKINVNGFINSFDSKKIKDIKPEIVNIHKVAAEKPEKQVEKPNTPDPIAVEPSPPQPVPNSDLAVRVNQLPDSIKELVINPPNINRS